MATLNTSTAPTLTAHDFIAKWGPGGPAHTLTERAGAQAHFIDLCRLLGVAEPGDPARYTFEKGLTRTGTGSGRTDGFADVWLQGHFAWEYKAPGKSLDGALKQLMMYALPLESPPLLVVSDRLRISGLAEDRRYRKRRDSPVSACCRNTRPLSARGMKKLILCKILTKQ